MTMETTDLDAADILAAHITHVPVNARVDQAIAAHRIAFMAFESDPGARRLAEDALRAIVLARTPELADYRTQLDYLTALPETSWPDSSAGSREALREATLEMIRRQIAWVTACA